MPAPCSCLTARNRLGKKLRKPQNNTAFAKLSYLVNNCEPLNFFWRPRPTHDLNAWNRPGKKLRKQQNNTAFAKLSYLVNNCEPVSVGNSANVVFVARFSNQIVCFSTKSWDRKRFKSFLGVMGSPCQLWP